MTSTTSLDFQPLSGDLAPWIADPDAHGLLVTLTRIDLKPLPGQVPATLAGSVHVRVDEVVSSQRLEEGDLIELPAQQVADPMVRLRNTADNWNLLPLTAGRRWLLMCRLASDKRHGLALAAVELAPAAVDEMLQALRVAYGLERGVRLQRADAEGFVRALAAPSEVLYRYAIDGVAGRKVFGRDQGSLLLERVLRSQSVKGVRAVEAVTYALRMQLFAGSFGADAANVRILGLIAGGLVAEVDPALGLRWARLLTSATLGELSDDPKRDAEWRQQLLRAVKSPPAAAVLAALEKQPRPSDEGGQALFQRAIDAWRAAI